MIEILNYLNSLKNEKKYQVVDWAYGDNESPKSINHYLNWVEEKRHEPLSYLADHRLELRKNLKNFYSEHQSAISFLFSYEATHYALKKTSQSELKIASFTLGFDGFDYHQVIKDYLNEIKNTLVQIDPSLKIQYVLDVHPVLERDLAYSMGLGFFGKNTMLIHPKLGSFFIIGSILLNKRLKLDTRSLEPNHCGQCTRCIDACPTQALDEKGLIAKKCISTFTIEQFKPDSKADESMNLSSGYIFGCDICQDVCPFNTRRVRLNLIEEKALSKKAVELFNSLTNGKIEDLIAKFQHMTNGEFKKIFIGTSFFRSGKRGLLKNFKKALEDLN